MQKTTRRTFLQASGAAAIGAMGAGTNAQPQTAGPSPYRTRYPAVPRIDCHAHVGRNPDMIQRYHRLREMMLHRRGADLAMWINLGNRGEAIDDLEAVEKAGRGRLLCCISDYKPHDGLDIPPDSLSRYLTSMLPRPGDGRHGRGRFLWRQPNAGPQPPPRSARKHILQKRCTHLPQSRDAAQESGVRCIETGSRD